jgi:methyl coenzyme M reductase subunit C
MQASAGFTSSFNIYTSIGIPKDPQGKTPEGMGTTEEFIFQINRHPQLATTHLN